METKSKRLNFSLIKPVESQKMSPVFKKWTRDSKERFCSKCKYVRNRETDFHKGSNICKECKSEYNANRKQVTKNKEEELEKLRSELNSIKHNEEELEELRYELNSMDEELGNLRRELNDMNLFLMENHIKAWRDYQKHKKSLA